MSEDEYCGTWIPEDMKEEFIKEFAKEDINSNEN